MANRLNGRVVYLICSLVFLQPTLEKMLDTECVKRCSASYKQRTTQTTNPQYPNDQQADLPAYLAVDGDKATCSNTSKVTSTNPNDFPWWQVDLHETTNITFIQITNSRRQPTALRVYLRYDVNSHGRACGNYHVFAGHETRIIRCKPTYGRAVRVVGMRTNDYLSLCEVQVFNDSVQLTQGVTYEIWFNTTDVSYRFINTKPDSRGILPTFDAPRDISDTYGVRMKTYFSAPENGSYIFNMTGDNKCTLYIRDVRNKFSTVIIGRIPRDDTVPASNTPYYLTKGRVYELTALMVEINKKDHLRVGVTFPNGTFVGPMNSRIFINEKAAQSLTKNLCVGSDVTLPPSLSTARPTDINNEDAIKTAVSRLLQDREGFETKFQTLDELERLGFEKANGLKLGNKPFASYVVQVKHFVFAAVALNLHTRLGFNFPGNLGNFNEFADHSSISFPKGAFPSTIGRTSAVFMMFKPLKEMLEQTGDEGYQLTDNIISATMEQGVVNERSMNKPFTLVFRNTEVSIKGQRHCVFWLEGTQCTKDATFGRWSDKGCSLVHQNGTHTTCQCNHLTKFAILFPVSEGFEEDEMKLELITYVGLSLSSTGCFITFAVYLILRITKTLKSIVHLNLVFALGLAGLLFLFGNLAEKNKDLCFASTVLTFYLYLAVFAWMLIEGVHLYFLVIRVFGSEDRQRRRYYHIVGWGVPMVIVAITTGVLRYDLMSEKHCWLSAKTASIWVFVGPALFVVLVNTVILAAVLRTTMTLLRNDPGHRKEKSAMRTLAMLVPILGTTWVFGVVAFTNESIVFQYIFAVCNAFQGFFIFILYCLFNTEVRHEYQRRRKAWRTERELDSKRLPQNNSFDL